MTEPLKPHAPKQIGSVVGVDRMDGLDRQKLRPEIKLALLCDEARGVYGRDPRGLGAGGFAFVARPRVILQLLMDLGVSSGLTSVIRLQRAMVIAQSRADRGRTVADADVVGWWENIPIAVRCTVKDDQLWILPLDKIPESKQIDRRQAGSLRVAAHNGKLHMLQDQG